MDKLTIGSDRAALVASWIRGRKGVQEWGSVDLSDPSHRWLTPATNQAGTPNTAKPSWQSTSEPAATYTRLEDVLVSEDVEVRRFRVGLRLGAQGLRVKLTDGSTRKVRAAVAKAGDGAYYTFDYEEQKAVIMAPKRVIGLVEWLKENEG